MPAPATQTGDKVAINVGGLRCTLGGCEILRGISFSLAAGDMVSVIGPNGAGKTTLLKSIMRIVPSSGEVGLFGTDTGDYSQAELARLVSYVPQTLQALPPFSVIEFVLMARYPHLSVFTGLSPHDYLEAEAALSLTGMKAYSERTIDTLSGGERQRVMIAAAICQGADVLLLDEPAAFLDPHHQHEVIVLLRRLNLEYGRTVVMVTHDINTASLAGSRVLGLRGGEVVYDGAADRLLTGENLHRIYGSDFRFIEDRENGIRFVAPAGMP